MNDVYCPNCHHKFMPAAGYTPLSVVKCAHCQHIYLMGQGVEVVVSAQTKMGEINEQHGNSTSIRA